MTHYLWLEIEGIQRFVFSSPKLKVLRGGSALLDIFNRTRMVEEAKKRDGEVVLVGGGHCLIRGLSYTTAEELGLALRRELYRDTDGLVGLAFGIAPADGTWPTIRDAYRADLTRRARQGAPAPAPLPPFVALCSYCGLSPARELYREQGERRPASLCHSCRQRLRAEHESSRAHRETIWERLRRRFPADEVPDGEAYCAMLPPRELAELVELGSGSRYLAYVYCDGNGMGKKLREVESADAYGKLSGMVDDALHRAVASALWKHCRPWLPRGRFAAEVLLLGGDDLIAVMPADRGADFTSEVLDVFHRETKRELRLSAGVVFAPLATPIAILQQVADDLLRSAKRYAYLDEARQRLQRKDVCAESSPPPERPPACGYIDFQELTSTEIEVCGRRAHAITCRPYRCDDFAELVRRTRELRASGVPRGRLHAMAEALRGTERQARSITRLVVGRANEERERSALLDILKPLATAKEPRAQSYPKYPDGGDVPYDLYWDERQEHLWSAVPDALELIDHLSVHQQPATPAGRDA